ncbi:hypothetical protein BDK51DRAFT_29946 [Blyttiomyces helicus]|uniref:Uncharacterized protein n=1 Tax=Blyttiomyces helicus TaxID=388810 RepID=A0A4P9WK93_9FUNG|nr:hypothetical protein BDK51DRAFT_29946 [Blyttiomyces helicus]|eukprot:RKO93399.1 hypothetical protein BDK51DRAFT_29946 [Blyttiomyces helicus]
MSMLQALVHASLSRYELTENFDLDLIPDLVFNVLLGAAQTEGLEDLVEPLEQVLVEGALVFGVRLDHSMNSSCGSKRVGRLKCRGAHSSCIDFWIGMPARSWLRQMNGMRTWKGASLAGTAEDGPAVEGFCAAGARTLVEGARGRELFRERFLRSTAGFGFEQGVVGGKVDFGLDWGGRGRLRGVIK